jgi:hypothetical protein
VSATTLGRGRYNDLQAAEEPPTVQGTLALSFVLPSGLEAVPTVPLGLRLLPRHPSDLVDDGEFGPQPTRRADLPEPARWAGRFVQAIVEVLAGDRPPTQLVRWTTKDVYDDMVNRIRRTAALSARPLVRSVHVSEPADGVAEVAALVRRGARCSAVAFRLEGLDGRWQCTALELG